MQFKELANYPGYLCGDDGHVYSTIYRKGKNRKPRRMAQNVQSNGKYYSVAVKDGDKFKTHRVHRLICMAFHGYPPTERHTASHIDGNWMNNKPENLKWETYSENLLRKKEHGTDDTGFKNSRALISEEELLRIRELLKEKQLTHEQIGLLFGVNRVFITKIATGKRYKSQGLPKA